LWELIISKKPDDDISTDEDFENYAQILVDTSALKQNNNPIEVVPKLSRGCKWRKILSNIWTNRKNYEGQGIGPTIVIPADPMRWQID